MSCVKQQQPFQAILLVSQYQRSSLDVHWLFVQVSTGKHLQMQMTPKNGMGSSGMMCVVPLIVHPPEVVH